MNVPLLLAALILQATPQHLYHYDTPDITETLQAMEAHRNIAWIPLHPGATLISHDRRFTITAVHNDRKNLYVRGTVTNLTGQPIPSDPIYMQLDETPRRQAVWFRQHPSTPQYHYGPGFNGHTQAPAFHTKLGPGQTGKFTVHWDHYHADIAREPLTDLALLIN